MVESARVAVPEQVLVRIDWSEAEASPVQHANQVLAQVGPPTGGGLPDGVYLAFGSISPPVIVGDEEQRAERSAELQGSTLKVAVQVRMHISREMLDDVIQVLKTTAEQYDAASAAVNKLQERG